MKYSELPAIAYMFRPQLQMGSAVRSGPSSHTGASMGALMGVGASPFQPEWQAEKAQRKRAPRSASEQMAVPTSVGPP